jgi:hypothetical protein
MFRCVENEGLMNGRPPSARPWRFTSKRQALGGATELRLRAYQKMQNGILMLD